MPVQTEVSVGFETESVPVSAVLSGGHELKKPIPNHIQKHYLQVKICLFFFLIITILTFYLSFCFLSHNFDLLPHKYEFHRKL